MNKEQAIKKVADLEKKVAEATEELELLKNIINEPENVRWKFNYCGDYWTINADGEIFKANWNNHYVDDFRYSIGNCFKTEGEAIEYKEKLIFNQEVLDFIAKENGDWKVDWSGNSQLKHILYYDYYSNVIRFTHSYNVKYFSDNKYFKSREIGEKIIAKFDNEKLKRYFI